MFQTQCLKSYSWQHNSEPVASNICFSRSDGLDVFIKRIFTTASYHVNIDLFNHNLSHNFQYNYVDMYMY